MANEIVPVRRELSNVDSTIKLADVMARSGFFADARDAAQAVVKVLAGQEMGVGPVSSMTGINLIKGKISISANLMAAAVRRSGRYDYHVKRHDDQRCEIEFTMDGKVIGNSIFTIDDARKAGLSGDNWKKYPRNMLFARAMSNGVKWYCPDVFGGPVYTADELGAAVDAEDGSVISVSPVQIVQARVTISAEQAQELEQLVTRKGTDRAKLLSYFKVESFNDLSPEQFAEAVSRLRSRADVSNAADTLSVHDSEISN
jgi:hypothetical protein